MAVGLAISIPDKEVSAWVAETTPKETRAWLATLPLADSPEAAREIYQSLYTLNRLELGAQDRLKLMELYHTPVATVADALLHHFSRAVLPLTPRKRQLAEFIRQLHLEMANGYKCVVYDAYHTRMRWGRKKMLAVAVEAAMRYLGEVLQQSYQIYIPCPSGVWTEVHELYRFAEHFGWFVEHSAGAAKTGGDKPPIYHLYLEIVLLGLCNPYQLPQGECRRIDQFLERWAGEAMIHRELEVANPVGHFLIDLSKDAPPVPYPRDVSLQPVPHLRALNAVLLASTVQGFINRLKKGASTRMLDLGTECLDSACLDMLRRMIRFWGLAARRQRSRVKRRGYYFVASGINAVHFFSSGQKPFAPPGQATQTTPDKKVSLPDKIDTDSPNASAERTFVDLDEQDAIEETAASGKRLAEPLLRAREVYRVDRWQIRDESVGGMLLATVGSHGSYVRVGELIGIQDPASPAQWRVGVVRWMRAPDEQTTEMGVAMLAPTVIPVALKAAVPGANDRPYSQGLLLPSVEVLRQPASLIVPRGSLQQPDTWLLSAGEAPLRRVKALEVLEQTGSFERIVFADAAGA